jgi:hypothetical protein
VAQFPSFSTVSAGSVIPEPPLRRPLGNADILACWTWATRQTWILCHETGQAIECPLRFSAGTDRSQTRLPPSPDAVGVFALIQTPAPSHFVQARHPGKKAGGPRTTIGRAAGLGHSFRGLALLQRKILNKAMNGNRLTGGGTVSPQSRACLESGRNGRFQRRQSFRRAFSKREQWSGLDLGNERQHPNRRRTRESQSRTGLASHRNRRFQSRRRFRHSLSKHEHGPSLDLGNEREQANRRRTRQRQSRTELVLRSGPAAAAAPTSFFRT